MAPEMSLSCTFDFIYISNVHIVEIYSAFILGEMHEKHRLKQESQFDFFLILVTQENFIMD